MLRWKISFAVSRKSNACPLCRDHDPSGKTRRHLRPTPVPWNRCFQATIDSTRCDDVFESFLISGTQSIFHAYRPDSGSRGCAPAQGNPDATRRHFLGDLLEGLSSNYLSLAIATQDALPRFHRVRPIKPFSRGGYSRAEWRCRRPARVSGERLK